MTIGRMALVYAVCTLLMAGAGLCADPLAATLASHGLFSDGKVLQRDKPIPVWGRAPAGEKVAVTIG